MKTKLKNILESISSIFSSSLIWNIIFPFFVGFLINFSLTDSRQLIIFLVWIPILSLPYFIFKLKILLVLPWLATFLIGFLDIINWVTIKAPVTQYSLFIMLESSLSEATSFMNLKWSFLYLVVPVYIIVSLFLLLKNFKKEIKSPKYVLAFFLLFSFVFIAENAFNQRFLRKSTPTAVSAISSFYIEMGEYQNKANDIELFLGKVNASSLDIDNEQITVVVLGESTTRNKMSLYDYERNTNPLLSKRNDLAVLYRRNQSVYTYTGICTYLFNLF